MSNPLRAILVLLFAAIIGGELIWKCLGHFDVDIRAFGLLACVSIAFLLSSTFYEHARKNPCIGSMLFGFGFLLIFGSSINVITYFSLTVCGPRIDGLLAAIDRAIGINWPELILFATAHPSINSVFHLAYNLSTYEALALVIIWGKSDRTRLTEQLCLALAAGGVTTVIIWTLAPSFGAFTIYGLPTAPDVKRAFALDADYANLLLSLWAHGPGHISPLTVKGLVGFPSFHTAQAIIATWYARKTRYLFYPFLAFNAVVVLSTPIQGGHHVVDVIGGFAVAALAIWLADLVTRRVTPMTADKGTVPALATAD